MTLNSFKHRIKMSLLDFLVGAYERVYGEATDQYERLRDPRDFERFLIAEDAARRIYPKYVFSDYGRVWLDDEEFWRHYLSFDRQNLRSADRKYFLRELLGMTAALEGGFAECGVYKGASAVLLCREATSHSRRVHLFDSFEGLSRPSPVDGPYWRTGDLDTGLSELQRIVSPYGETAVIHQGWIPDRFEDVADSAFCFVHVDVDLYQPTLDSFSFFYERLVPSGVILCDDYGFEWCPGARRAVDEFMQDKPERLVRVPTGQAFVVRI